MPLEEPWTGHLWKEHLGDGHGWNLHRDSAMPSRSIAQPGSWECLNFNCEQLEVFEAAEKPDSAMCRNLQICESARVSEPCSPTEGGQPRSCWLSTLALSTALETTSTSVQTTCSPTPHKFFHQTLAALYH